VRALAPRLVWLSAGAVLALGLWRSARIAAAYLGSPWSLDYAEGAILAQVQLLAERGTYFTSLRAYPLVHGAYPPLFHLIVLPFHIAIGPSLLYPRLVSTTASVALLAALFLLLRRLTGDRLLAAALSLTLFTPWFVQTWAPLGRVDMLALFLTVAGLAAWKEPRSRLGLLPPFAFFWLAFLTKHNAVLAPLAVCAHRLLRRDARGFLRALAGFALPLAGILGLLAAATRGEAWRHLGPMTFDVAYEWPRALESYGEFAMRTAPLLLLAAAALVLARRQLVDGQGAAMLGYLGLNLVGLASIGKVGAAQNYYIEPFLSALIAGALAIRALEQRFGLSGVWKAAAVLVVALAATTAPPQARHLPQAIRRPEQAKFMRELTEIVRATDGPILSENLSVLVVNDKPVLVDPFGLLMLARAGHLRADLVVRDCELRRFALVIAEKRLFDVPALGECLERNYSRWTTLGPYQLYH
jgi:hypothetical protein